MAKKLEKSDVIEPPKKKRGRPPKTVKMADGTLIKETPEVLSEDDRDKSGRKNPTFEWFSIILYPYDDFHPDVPKEAQKGDPLHEVALRWIENYEPEYAYILHDKDKTEEGLHKKNHVHVIFKHYAKVTLKTAQKTFVCWHMDKHLQTCSAPLAMAYYLPHRSPDAIAQGKYQYPITDVSHTPYFDKTYAKLNKTEILFNSGKGMIADILTEYKCDTLGKAFTTLERLRIDYTEYITDYMLTQLVHDVQYLLKNKPTRVVETQYVTLNHRGEVLSTSQDYYKHDHFQELATDLELEKE